MNRVSRAGLTITIAMATAWVVCGQDYGQAPTPPPPPSPPGIAPRVAQTPRPEIPGPAPRAVPRPPAMPDEFSNDTSRPAIVPAVPESPEAPEGLEVPEPAEPPEPGEVPSVGVIAGVPGGVIGGVPGVVAAVPPMPPVPPISGRVDYEALLEDARAAADMAPHPADLEALLKDAKAATVQALSSPEFKARTRDARIAGEQAKALGDQLRLGPLAFAAQPAPKIASADEENRYYERGQRDLERNRWNEAADNFSEAVSRGGARADGALYWKAYALNKLGRRDDALAAIAELRKSHPSSRWLDDARALEIEIKQAGGKPVNPESADDEELKLMALNSFMNTEPDRALPLLEKLLHSSQSPKIKERALFVLTQSDSSKARLLVVQMAKGGSNPDLQMKAVHYLGVMGARKELGEVYAATNDLEVKRAVLHGLMVAGAKDELLAAAKGEKSTELRQQAIHWLGTMGAEPELWQIYQVEPSAEVRQTIIHALFIGGKTDHLVEVARTAKEPELRQQAIHWLGVSDSHRTGDALASIYGSESNNEVKKQIVHALFIQGNGKALVEIARKETNMDLKKQIVHDLSLMKSKEGTDYLLELLNK
jgi:tetratricopeptide (TPR) repeat protein